ncbi:MAG: c-type cytochrome [Flavobacteriaceae bacterium]|nr:c-type cytochrome [Flavobacteriaceae bacterium]
MKSVDLHNRLAKVLLKSFTFLLLFSMSFSAMAQDVAVDEARQKEGRGLFRSLCVSCHKLDKKFIGPALGGVEERRENEWLKAWIRDNASLRATGDKDALAIYAEFKQSNMTAFPQLTDKNIDDILYYTTVGDPIKKGEKVIPGMPGEAPNKWLMYLLASMIVVAFLIIAALLKTISELKGAPKTPGTLGTLHEVWEGIKKNTFLHVAFTIFMLLVIAYFLFGSLFKIGVDQGYQPFQEIKFSHKIHAGDNKIDCQYCPSSAKHSRH